MMTKLTKVILLALAALLLGQAAGAEQPGREQLQGLDEQVQAIKSDVLSIAAELNLLEEKLLYPSQTEVAVFVALAAGETFRLDSIDLTLDGRAVTHHLYTFKELEALRKGGVQRLYTGNLGTGEHPLEVTCRGKTAGGGDVQVNGSFTVSKDVGPGIVEIVVAEQAVSFNDQ